jgi:hypothetical protein
MEPLISDLTTNTQSDGLERFIERYLGPRHPDFGATDADVNSIMMPAPLSRFFRFAGRWPGQDPKTPYENRFCRQDTFCAIHAKAYAPALKLMDNRLSFVCENQGVWVAATEPFGADPPVWISEDSSHWGDVRKWRRLEKPLSHFLVSFVLQELLFSSTFVSAAPDVSGKFKKAGLTVEPVWIAGEYAWGFMRPSYYLVEGSILLRECIDQADGDNWYACEDEAGQKLLQSFALSTRS